MGMGMGGDRDDFSGGFKRIRLCSRCDEDGGVVGDTDGGLRGEGETEEEEFLVSGEKGRGGNGSGEVWFTPSSCLRFASGGDGGGGLSLEATQEERERERERVWRRII